MLPRASAPTACSAPTHTRSSSTGEPPLRALTGCCTLSVHVVVGGGHSCSVSIVCSAPHPLSYASYESSCSYTRGCLRNSHDSAC
jgi:hypothetical protein